MTSKEPKIVESKEETATKSCQLLPGGFAGNVFQKNITTIYKILSHLKK